MKVLDPQSAVLTNAEVQRVLDTHPERPPDRPIGGYPIIDLQGYRNVRKDFTHYLHLTLPHTLVTYPRTSTEWLTLATRRFKRLGLTKTESLMMINHGLGLPTFSPESTRPEPEENPHENTESQNGHSEHQDQTAHVDEHVADAEKIDLPTPDRGDRPEIEPEPRRQQSDQQDSGSDHLALLRVIVEDLEARYPLDEQREELLRVIPEALEEAEVETVRHE